MEVSKGLFFASNSLQAQKTGILFLGSGQVDQTRSRERVREREKERERKRKIDREREREREKKKMEGRGEFHPERNVFVSFFPFFAMKELMATQIDSVDLQQSPGLSG